MVGEGEEQLTLLPVPRPRRTVLPAGPAPVDPVAVVHVDTGLPHLDRPFDYLVPADLDDDVRPGVRVKVRFSGRDVDGYVLERRASADFAGTLRPIRRVVSTEPVLTPTLLAVCREVAARSAGTLGDVLRLAIPPRHAAAERALPASVAAAMPHPDPPLAPWTDLPAGSALLDRLAAGESPRAAVLLPPAVHLGSSWPERVVDAVLATARSGRGAVVVVPDGRDVDRVEEVLVARLGKGHHVRLTADQGPQARYTAWLKALRGHVRVVVGTRAAVHAPVDDLGLVLWWDDGDSSHAEPRAPYAHVRTVARVRADLEGASLLTLGFSRSTALQALVETQRMLPVAPARALVRARAPRVHIAGEGVDAARDAAAGRARLPSVAWETTRRALVDGPVLVQVPRRGYLPALACHDCRRPARCRECAGPVALPGPVSAPQCRWCGRVETRHTCAHCGSPRLRATVVGARRTAEELGRAFPGVPVHTSGGSDILAAVPAGPRLVIATPGAEPDTPDGYAAALLLDAWALLDRPELLAAEECVRRWLNAAALVRPGSRGGAVVLVGAPGHVTLPQVETLVRWDPHWFAERELADRRALRLPPAAVVGTVTGRHDDLRGSTADAPWPASAHVLGPLPLGGTDVERLIIRVDPADRDPLANLLRQIRARWAAARTGEAVQVRLDPPDPAA